MSINQARDLFQLQTDLIDLKVDMAAAKAIDRILECIADLKCEMNSRFAHIEQRLVSVEHRLIAVETKLGMVNETEKEIRAKLTSYGFKSGWVLLGVAVTYIISQLHFFF